MEDEGVGDAKSSARPRARDRHVLFGRKRVGQLMECQGCLVTEHADPARPEPSNDEILMIAGRVVGQPEDSARNALDSPLTDVILQQRG